MTVFNAEEQATALEQRAATLERTTQMWNKATNGLMARSGSAIQLAAIQRMQAGSQRRAQELREQAAALREKKG